MSETGKTIALIEALKGNGGGGSSLPAVTSADNGKVLGVVDGAWAASEQNLYVITKDAEGKASIGRNEIASLISNGVCPVYYDGDYIYLFQSIDSVVAAFYRINSLSDSNNTRQIIKRKIYTNKAISSETLDFYAKPSSGIPETDLAQAVKDKLNKFIVTLTPTALDYSGTMDKTVSEINAAYEAGMEIVFRVVVSANEHVDTSLNACNVDTTYTYPSFDTYLIEPSTNVLVRATTECTNDGTKQTYSTTVYSLTPAS